MASVNECQRTRRVVGRPSFIQYLIQVRPEGCDVQIRSPGAASSLRRHGGSDDMTLPVKYSNYINECLTRRSNPDRSGRERGSVVVVDVEGDNAMTPHRRVFTSKTRVASPSRSCIEQRGNR